MKKIRINELARELEVKAHEILDRLPELGVAEKKTHSSSIDEDVAIKLRRLYGFETPDEQPEAAEETPEAPPAEAEFISSAAVRELEKPPVAEVKPTAGSSMTPRVAEQPVRTPAPGAVPPGEKAPALPPPAAAPIRPPMAA